MIRSIHTTVASPMTGTAALLNMARPSEVMISETMAATTVEMIVLTNVTGPDMIANGATIITVATKTGTMTAGVGN